MNLYNLKMFGNNKFQMAKFDSDFNVAAVYNLEPKGAGYTCDCPANNRTVILKPCKHKRMMPVMLGAVNTDRFYDPETRGWCQPIAREALGSPSPIPMTIPSEQPAEPPSQQAQAEVVPMPPQTPPPLPPSGLPAPTIRRR
jgi:hypothetical protein